MTGSYSHPRHVWTGQSLYESPAVRIVNLAYEEIEKIQMSFTIDLSSSKEAWLDPTHPIKINGQNVMIPELPRERDSLGYVEKVDIDVTDLLKWSLNGENNRIEVFYRVKDRNWLRRQVGMLKLSLKIFLPTKDADVITISPQTKFCMFCQRNIPDDSVCCPYCCERQIAGGANPKKCVNCSEMLPPRARFCRKFGHAQPA